MTLRHFLFIFIIFSFIHINIIFGQTDNFEKPISMNLVNTGELVIIIFFLIIGAFTWKLTHKYKERHYFSAEVKKQVLIDQKLSFYLYQINC